VNDFELWPGGPKLKQNRGAFPVGTDSVLLSHFVPLGGVRRALDLGSGSGIISILLLNRAPSLTMDLAEIVPSAAALSRENGELNGFSSRMRVMECDFRTLREADVGKYDLVVTNPPYYEINEKRSTDTVRDSARAEGNCTLPEVCAAAAGLLGTGGKFCMVYPAFRMAQALCTLSAHRLEPKRLRLVQERRDTAPSVFLVECRRDGKPGLTVEPTLIIREPDGTETQEVRDIYHR